MDPRPDLDRDVHAAAGHHGRQRRPARHPAQPARQPVEPAVGRRRLLADARRLPAHRRLARRPARPPARLLDRLRHLHRRLVPLRDRRRSDPAQLRPGAPGGRRRGDVRHLAGADRPGVPRQRPGDRVRHLGGDDRRRGRRRPAGRRPDHRAPRLGMDLLRQRADRGARDRPHRAAPGQRRRAGPRADRPARPGDLLRRPLPADLRPDPRQPGRLGQRRHRRLAGRLGRPPARLPGGRGAQRPPDARPRPVPQAGLQRRLRRRLRPLGGDVRPLPLPDDLHAGGARLLAAGDRPALPAAHGPLLHRLADRRLALAPHPDPHPARRRADDGRRSGCC